MGDVVVHYEFSRAEGETVFSLPSVGQAGKPLSLAEQKAVSAILHSRFSQYAAATLVLQKRVAIGPPVQLGAIYSLEQHVPPGDYNLCRLYPVCPIGPIYLEVNYQGCTRSTHLTRLFRRPPPLASTSALQESPVVVMVTGLAAIHVDDLDVMRLDFQVHVNSEQPMRSIAFEYCCADTDNETNAIHIRRVSPMMEVRTTAISHTSTWTASTELEAAMTALPAAKLGGQYSSQKEWTVALDNWTTTARIGGDKRSVEWTLTWRKAGEPQPGERLGLTVPLTVLCQLPDSFKDPTEFAFPGFPKDTANAPDYISTARQVRAAAKGYLLAIERLQATVVCENGGIAGGRTEYVLQDILGSSEEDDKPIRLVVAEGKYRTQHGLPLRGKPFFFFRKNIPNA